ncbi:MAG: succinate dehydrogenase, hydrophobic membrane anchor protein [Actinomycetota bacterium]|jgi:succinate dehydrogenase / fumarate reductase membrane anchor subunit|nr:succinate dehydrogenase, hydrophobic membrane anchor protein [Actinomycetota bacterium]HEX3327040.1 succinate dehydrogenase, hydrophobic membrane anchor protein [Actinomycetota bacterium]
MATVEDVYRKHKPQAFSPERRPSSFEVWSWFFMRISGVILLFLVLIHLYIMHLMGKGVERVDYAFVASRWASVGWKTFDWAMLFLALLHGTNGLRVIIEDYVHAPALRTTIKTVLYTLTFVLMIMGTAVVVTFKAPA